MIENMKIYISGPMTGLPEYNYPAFFECERMLKEKFPLAIILNPARIDDGLVYKYSNTREHYIRKSVEMVLQATDMFMLPGWENSAGAKLEALIAKEVGLTFYGSVKSPDSTTNNKLSIIEEAKQITDHDRQIQYGNPKDHFTDVGRIWGSILRIDDIPPAKVGLMMVGLKLAREAFKPKYDNRLDAIGYTLLVDKLENESM